jgi:hypothetical protein
MFAPSPVYFLGIFSPGRNAELAIFIGFLSRTLPENPLRTDLFTNLISPAEGKNRGMAGLRLQGFSYFLLSIFIPKRALVDAIPAELVHPRDSGERERPSIPSPAGV